MILQLELYRFHHFFSGFIVQLVKGSQKDLPVLPDKRFDDREFIYFEFLILWRMEIIKSPLFKRDISADEMPLSFKEKVLLKQVLKAVKGTNIE